MPNQERKDYYEMIEALQDFNNGFHKPIVNKIHPYVQSLEWHLNNITKIMCNSCPIKSKCKDLNGCYCLKEANELINGIK